MTVPTDNNILVKEYNRISKYKNLEIEIEKMWCLKTILGQRGAMKKFSAFSITGASPSDAVSHPEHLFNLIQRWDPNKYY